MPVLKYMCEKCAAVYDHKGDALQCESDHVAREAGIVVKAIAWRHDAEGKYHNPNDARKMYPAWISLKFSGDQGDFAVFRLERIGFNPKIT